MNVCAENILYRINFMYMFDNNLIWTFPPQNMEYIQNILYTMHKHQKQQQTHLIYGGFLITLWLLGWHGAMCVPHWAEIAVLIKNKHKIHNLSLVYCVYRVMLNINIYICCVMDSVQFIIETLLELF